MIEYLPVEILKGDLLERIVYPNLERTLYWSDRWDPAWYLALARAGFICIAIEHPELGPLVIPEMQDRYAVLDWPALHVSRNVQRLLRSGRLEREGMELRLCDPRPHVLPGIRERYGEDCWVIDEYLALLDELLDEPYEGLAIHGVELWSHEHEMCVAGEFGYSVGASYTSLSGFCSPDEEQWRDFGTLQLVLLAKALEAHGFAFWNLGHAEMPYKRALGAEPLPRAAFLARWFAERDREPGRRLVNGERLWRAGEGLGPSWGGGAKLEPQKL